MSSFSTNIIKDATTGNYIGGGKAVGTMTSYGIDTMGRINEAIAMVMLRLLDR